MLSYETYCECPPVRRQSHLWRELTAYYRPNRTGILYLLSKTSVGAIGRPEGVICAQTMFDFIVKLKQTVLTDNRPELNDSRNVVANGNCCQMSALCIRYLFETGVNVKFVHRVIGVHQHILSLPIESIIDPVECDYVRIAKYWGFESKQLMSSFNSKRSDAHLLPGAGMRNSLGMCASS